VAVRVAYEKRSVYLRIGKRFSLEDWIDLCGCEKRGRNKKAAERKELKVLMNKVEVIVNQLIDEGRFSLKRLQDVFSGKKNDGRTIYSIWDKYIQGKKDEGKAGTARSHTDVKRRFEKDMGTCVSFDQIDRNFILKW